MAKTLIKYNVLCEVGAIFASDLTTEFVELTNNKTVDFIIATGVGTTGKTTITVKAKKEDGEEVSIPFKEKIGQTTYNNIDSVGKEFTATLSYKPFNVMLSIDNTIKPHSSSTPPIVNSLPTLSMLL